MSLIRQVAVLLGMVLLLALAGSVAMNTLAARDTLKAQLRLKNADNAAALALALSQHRGDATTMALLMAAQFDTGHYRLLRLTAPDGRVQFERQVPLRASGVPAWFVAALPVAAPAGVAQVSDGWREIGRLELESHTAYVHEALWAGAVQVAGWLLAVGLAAAGVAWLGVRALQRPLLATVDQARALQEGRFVTVPLPTVPELRTVGEAMNSMVGRLQQSFDRQARQLADLRVQAEQDALSGLSNRRHFMARLETGLAGEQAQRPGGLVLLRVLDLDGLNRRHGRALADSVLRAVAEAVAAYPAQVPGGFAGRLNGADFALALPADQVADETAQALLQALQVLLPALAPEAAVCAGSAELAGMTQPGPALAAVDDALAEAEAEGPFQHRHRAADGATRRADDEWRREIDRALAEDRVALAEQAVLDAQGVLLHRACTLRLAVDGPIADSPLWLAHALRSRRAAALDLRAVTLALTASTRDGLARSVSITVDSLAAPGFVDEVQRQLRAAGPAAAARLMIDVPERAASEQRALLRDAAAQWAACGTRLGLAHAGGAADTLARLHELGLAFVKIDRSHLEGVAGDEQVRRVAAGLVTLLHGMGLRVLAEGVKTPEDLAALWALGFDGAAGPAVGAGR